MSVVTSVRPGSTPILEVVAFSNTTVVVLVLNSAIILCLVPEAPV